jgi:hypothetical protein
MKSLIAFAAVLVLASAGARAAAGQDDIGPATHNRPVLTVDPASDDLNGRVNAHNQAIDAQNQAAQAQYQQQLAAYEQEKKAQAEAYEAELAAHDAKAAADMAAWRAQVRACAAGDTSQCAR